MRNVIKKIYLIYSIIYIVITILNFSLLNYVSASIYTYLVNTGSVLYHISVLFIIGGFVFLIYCIIKKYKTDALFIFFILLLLVLFTAVISIPLGLFLAGAGFGNE